MKRILLSIAVMLAALPILAQNDKAANILGAYSGSNGKFEYKVRVTQSSDGSFKATIFWVDPLLGPDGKVQTDVKNPDKSLRDTPIDKIVLISGLRYDEQKQQWSGAKIYDPTRGVRANALLRFNEDGKLAVKGSLLGLSETHIWTRLP